MQNKKLNLNLFCNFFDVILNFISSLKTVNLIYNENKDVSDVTSGGKSTSAHCFVKP